MKKISLNRTTTETTTTAKLKLARLTVAELTMVVGGNVKATGNCGVSNNCRDPR